VSSTAYDSRQGVGTLTLGGTEYGYQAAAVRLTPNVNSNDGTPTLAVPEPAPDSVVTWALNIDAIQDFENPTGLVNFLMDNALSEVAFVWTPLTEAGVVYSGNVQVLPMEVGGDVGVQVVTSVELPVVGEPTRVDGVFAASAGRSSRSSAKSET
jgi:hypothetical protein